MKRIIAFFCVLVMSFTLVACGDGANVSSGVTLASFQSVFEAYGSALHATESEEGQVITCHMDGAPDVQIRLIRGRKRGVKQASIHSVEIVCQNANFALVESEEKILAAIQKDTLGKDELEVIQYFSLLKILTEAVSGEKLGSDAVVAQLAGKTREKYEGWTVRVSKDKSASALVLSAEFHP